MKLGSFRSTELDMNSYGLRAAHVAIPLIVAGALVVTASLPTSAGADTAQAVRRPAGGAETITPLPDLTATAAGEPLLYLSTPDPVISSDILTIPPGGVSRWMTHPVPAYLYVLQGDLTVEFVDGKRQTFHAGQAFLQSRAQWHRGRNDGQTPVRFLAVFLGAKGVPTILHPPAAAISQKED
jgi:quercetin dioxygenase-like cupin family protein